MSEENFNADAVATGGDSATETTTAPAQGEQQPQRGPYVPRRTNLGARGFRPSGGGAGDGQGGEGGGPPRRGRRPGGRDRFTQRRKVCQFCVDKVRHVDYKDFQRLRRYLSDRGKIEPRRKTGTCAKHQRFLTTALKRARYMALLPYVSAHNR